MSLRSCGIAVVFGLLLAVPARADEPPASAKWVEKPTFWVVPHTH